MFVKTVRTVRLRYAFTQIVMVRSHFHCRNTVSKYWYFSETTRSFQLASHPTQAAYGGWLETDGLTQVYTTKTTQITFFSGWCKIGFEIKNEIEVQCQSSPKLIGILTVLRWILGPNLEILSWIGSEWWQGQAQNMAIFLLLSWIWPWSSRSITPQNNRDLNQGVLPLWSKFGDSSLNARQVIARTSKWLPHTQTHGQTNAANDNTRRPKLASGKNDLYPFRKTHVPW